MKSFCDFTLRCRPAGFVLALAVFFPILRAGGPANLAPRDNDSPALSRESRFEIADATRPESSSALAQIDAGLEQLDRLKGTGLTRDQKSSATAEFAELRERSDELKRQYDRSRFESLKRDLQSEIDRVTGWKETSAPEVEPPSNATVTITVTPAKLADSRPDAPQQKESEVQATLSKIDEQIAELVAKIDAATDTMRKNELGARLQSLWDRRNEIADRILKARRDTLVAESNGN